MRIETGDFRRKTFFADCKPQTDNYGYLPSITRITATEGFCASAASALTLFITQALKVPVSTTHVVSGSIIGVGATKRLSDVRRGVSVELVTAWIITIPVSALMGMATYWVVGPLL